jgi:lysophospholipase L1-like esterase
MATTVSSRAPSNEKLEKIFPRLVGDFNQIAGNFTKLVKLRKEENLNILREKYRVRQVSYKSRFTTKVERKYESKPLSEHTTGFLSLLKGVGGALGAAFLVLGVAGIAKMILSSSAGSYIGKFITSAFQSVLDLFKKTISFLKSILNSNEVKDAFIRAFNSLFQFVGNFLSKSFDIVKSLFNDRELRDAVIKTIVALFTAITSAIQASFNVIKDLFDSDINSIRTNLITLFSKLVDVLVGILGVTGGLFQSLVNSKNFMQEIKNIFTNLVELVIEAFKYDYTNTKTGERVNILQEVGLIILEAATLFTAEKLLKAKLLIAAVEMTAFRERGMGGVPLPSEEGKAGGKEEPRKTPRSLPVPGRGPRGRKGPISPDRLAQIRGASETRASKLDKFKYILEKNWRKIVLLAEKFRYSKLGQSKIIDLMIRLLFRLGVKISETRLWLIISTFVAGVVASGSGVATAVGIGILAINLYFAYDIITLIIENIDPLLKDIEDEEKKATETSAETPSDTSPIATQADVRRIDNEIDSMLAASNENLTPTTAGPSTTSPTQLDSQSDKKQGLIYTVGDSHSNGISNYGKRKGFVAKGKDGTSSIDKMHLEAINSIPEGSDVVISLGANDLANKNRKISSIVGSVTSVIAAAQKRGLNVTYLLPTLPASNKPYDPRRVELREALKMAVKVPIIDLGQASTTDKMGVHLDAAGYAQMAGKVSQAFKSSTSASSTTSTSNLPTENLNNVPENLQNLIQNSSDTLANVVKDLTQKNQGNSETEKKTTLAGILIAQLSTQLKTLDEMTGGKLGTSSVELNEALRYLEDEFNQGTSIFDLSTKAAVHKTETMVNTPPNIQKTNQNILNAILKRHYT